MRLWTCQKDNNVSSTVQNMGLLNLTRGPEANRRKKRELMAVNVEVCGHSLVKWRVATIPQPVQLMEMNV